MVSEFIPSKCNACREGQALDFDIAMAFQPIFDMRTGLPWAYEALVRGPNGESAASILDRVSPENRYTFDQRCRVAAIEGAVAAGILRSEAKLSINFMPNAVYTPKACIQLTLRTAAQQDFPPERLMFEMTENERMSDSAHICNIIDSYRNMGFTVALDDFGSGYAGLNLLSEFQTDVIKLDMELIRNIDTRLPRRMIVESMVALCQRMGIIVIAEGVETEAEYDAVRAIGIDLIQGYLLAKPMFEGLPPLAWTPPELRELRLAS